MKKLITDQLIEEYQKELDAVNKEKETAKYTLNFCKEQIVDAKIELLNNLISKLRSLQQEEMQNVKDAHTAGQFNAGVDSSPYEALVYFNQTFNQPTK